MLRLLILQDSICNSSLVTEKKMRSYSDKIKALLHYFN